MNKKKWIITATCVFAYVLYAICTGGIFVYNYKHFGYQRNIVLVEGLKSDLWIGQNVSGNGFIFMGFYHYSRLPRSLGVQIWDDKKQYSNIMIETISVVYAGGQRETIHANWRRELKPYTQVNSSSEGIKRTPMMLSDNIPECINNYSDCDITLTGFLTTLGNETIPFEVTEHFECKADFGVSTFWRMSASA